MHNKNQQLIGRLVEKTEAGEINWSSTSRPMQYTLSMTTNQIMIERTANMGIVKYRFSILDAKGDNVDSMLLQYSNSIDTPDATLLKKLYETAHRNANHIDETIDRLLDELN